MTRRLSPDELDLAPEQLSDADMKAWLESIDNQPDVAEEVIQTLSEAQKTAIRMASERGRTTHSGRGGWNVNTMRVLQKKGCVTQGKKSTWETQWHLTTLGMNVGRTLQKAFAANLAKGTRR